MIPHYLPTVPATLLPSLVEPFGRIGFAAPIGVRALRRPGRLGMYLVELDDGREVRLTTVRVDLSGSAGAEVLLAARRLEGEEALPVASRVVLLPLAVFGEPAWVEPLPAGRPADAWGDATTALAAMGRVIGAVAEVPQADVGVIATPHGYLGDVDRWSSSFLALAERWAGLARRHGTGLAPLVEDLLQRIGSADLALDGPPVLVPGDLEPGAIWLDSDGAVTRVDGWAPGWCGDRWSAWAPVLHLGADAIAQVRRAHPERPALAPQAERLGAYAAARVLFQLADAGAAIGPHERMRGVERALAMADALHTLPDRLRAADADIDEPDRPALARAALLAVVDRAVREPVVSDPRGWLAAAGASLVAWRIGDDPALAGWHAVARQAIALLEPGGPPRVPAPASTLPEAAAEAILRWVGGALIRGLGGHAPDGWDAALSEIAARLPPSTSPDERLARAVLVLAACASGYGDAALATPATAAAREAWGAVGWSDASAVPPAAWLAHFADPAAHGGVSAPVGLLLVALLGRPLALPASPGSILAILAGSCMPRG
jgi:hypothetical protein